jgi:uncharacterized protein (DUF2062 family)/trans-aconitate methyltransferase
VIGTAKARFRQFATTLFSEQLSAGRAAAAVFVGIFIGIVPIYGFQTLAALGLAFVFRLNKPLTFASTFINNPFLQPFLVVGSVQLGFFLRTGSFQPWSIALLSGAQMKQGLISWALGSIALGVLVGALGAAATALAISLASARDKALRQRISFVNRLYEECDSFDRGFVRWKMRLDRIFDLLATEELGSTGTVVDLGCGYGMALAFAAAGLPKRVLTGCDLNPHRIEVARRALYETGAELRVEDIRTFPLPPANLILILDVLQYLSFEEQRALLERCCAALEPGGRFIFRVHDKQRGFWSSITMAFDRLLFSCEGAGVRPLILTAGDYQQVLESAGLEVRSHRFRNRLPLAHVLFVAQRPLQEHEV